MKRKDPYKWKTSTTAQNVLSKIANGLTDPTRKRQAEERELDQKWERVVKNRLMRFLRTFTSLGLSDTYFEHAYGFLSGYNNPQEDTVYSSQLTRFILALPITEFSKSLYGKCVELKLLEDTSVTRALLETLKEAEATIQLPRTPERVINFLTCKPQRD